ncbi:hypothetical protein DYB31_009941 [Aphanomyces astaci]|uniref:Condensation domain-containing protein n=1 Tax=Aphanomyces astaci TaxID=112090 RepID=A0A397FDU0_APHAT|nr:hypothetical protein DYB31_009941 [Aphanomyces astaci]
MEAPTTIVQIILYSTHMASPKYFGVTLVLSLSYGATLVMRSEDDLWALSTASNLTCTHNALSLLDEPNQYPQLKVVAVAGEVCPVALKDLWAPRVKLFNLYGPSECAIMTHGSRLSLTESIAIGSHLAFWVNSTCICVSPGYINLPEMTEDRFLVDPFGHGRMYKTGDLGRLLPNGKFEIAGRQDSQVKLKGYHMMQHPSERPSFRHVVDYIQAQDTRAAEEFWRSYLNGVVVTSLETNGIPRNCLADSSDQPLSIDTTACLSSLSEAAQTLRVTVAELVKFAWAATVRKYTRQNDVVFGQVVANRDIPVHNVDRYSFSTRMKLPSNVLCRILGPLVSTVPCRVQFDDILSVTAMLEGIRLERGAVAVIPMPA